MALVKINLGMDIANWIGDILQSLASTPDGDPVVENPIRQRTKELSDSRFMVSWAVSNYITAPLGLKSALQKERRFMNDIMVDAFATVREASKRVLGMRHFDVQLKGGIILHRARYDR